MHTAVLGTGEGSAWRQGGLLVCTGDRGTPLACCNTMDLETGGWAGNLFLPQTVFLGKRPHFSVLVSSFIEMGS